jgi:hypothetical protein
VPASASLSIAAVADQVGGVDLPDPVVLAPGLRDVLGAVVDPRSFVDRVLQARVKYALEPEWEARR